MIQIGILRLQLKDQFNEAALGQILKLRSDIPEDIKLAMFEIMKEKGKALQAKDAESSGKSSTKGIM